MARNSLSSFTSSVSEANGYESISEHSLEVPKSRFIFQVDVFPSQVLGRGSFGTVCKGDWLGNEVAVKKLHKVFFEATVSESERNGVLRAFARELNILFQLKHPNIVTFFGVYDAEGESTLTLGPGTCLVQELLHCSLSVRNRAEPRLDFRQVIDISLGIVSGLRYLHERSEPIVHRDLASKNVLLSKYGVPKISDLGVAKVLNAAQKMAQHSRQPGTDLYMPPEVKIEGVGYDFSVDIYSFGVILMEVSIGRDPTATEAFRMGASLHIVPETERRRGDLSLLEGSPVKPIVLCCLARREDRPSAKTVYQQLKNMQRVSEYTMLPIVPVIATVPTYTPAMIQHHMEDPGRCGRLEHQLRTLRTEKAQLQLQLQRYSALSMGRRGSPDQLCSTSFPIVEREKVKFYEATLRSKDAEVHDLRQKLASLEQQLSKTSLSSQPLTNGSTTPEYSSAPRGYMARGVPDPIPHLPHPSSHATSLAGRDTDANEVKIMKRQLERFKNLSVELDLKLKDAKLELSQYATRQTGTDMQARFEVEALQAENRMLRSELDRAVRDNSRLQQESAFNYRQAKMY